MRTAEPGKAADSSAVSCTPPSGKILLLKVILALESAPPIPKHNRFGTLVLVSLLKLIEPYVHDMVGAQYPMHPDASNDPEPARQDKRLN